MVYVFEPSGELRHVTTLNRSNLWGPATIPGEEGNDLLVRQIDGEGDAALVRYKLTEDGVRPVSHTGIRALLESPVTNPPGG